ncbi:hypothetical protein CHARACLAT_003442 [Characodon lateralis]|uniref:Uncharacterized protein n=1 Tax=Characodon lateralis TaxID=208331 RepID=A0ABU7DZD9_9TELE|nr:hypothetical protein [Characodon lateralis]
MHANQACAPNNGPCVHLGVVGGAEVTRRPPLINIDKMFRKGTKRTMKRGEHKERPEADRRMGKGLLKLQGGTSSSLYLSTRYKGGKADTVTLSTAVEQMPSRTGIRGLANYNESQV